MVARSNPQRRSYYRVEFPLIERPCWVVGDTTFVVVDLAETSCRMKRTGRCSVNFEEPMYGLLRFADGDQVWVEGNFLREADNGIVVKFTKGVALKKIVALQRSMFQRYPARRNNVGSI